MAITTLLFIVVYLFCLVACLLVHPTAGIVGYVVTYTLAPSSQWWGSAFSDLGLRLSLIMGLATMVGLFLHRDRINVQWGLIWQERFLLLFVLWILASSYLGLPGDLSNNFAVKMSKVAFFIWMMGRIVTDMKAYKAFLWTLILTGTFLGFEAMNTSTAHFGRINTGVGGSDFSEGNFLAAHFAMLLPFLGVLMFQGTLKTRLILFLSSISLVNGIVLCRSRGVFVALFLGVVSAVFIAPKGMRGKLLVLLVLGVIGGSMLVDQGFWNRMSSLSVSIANVEYMDTSSSHRLNTWKVALAMFKDHPLGIGQGNFPSYVGLYNTDVLGKDTHNTFLRCLAELGAPGAGLYLLMIANAFWTLRKVSKTVGDRLDASGIQLHVFGLTVSLIIFLSAGMFISHTYIEFHYWILLMPSILQRIVENLTEEDASLASVQTVNVELSDNYILDKVKA